MGFLDWQRFVDRHTGQVGETWIFECLQEMIILYGGVRRCRSSTKEKCCDGYNEEYEKSIGDVMSLSPLCNVLCHCQP